MQAVPTAQFKSIQVYTCSIFKKKKKLVFTTPIMPYCCVPFCTSLSGKKNSAGVSFHEFPVDMSLRASWLKRISRKDYVVNDRSASSVVCSLHFTSNDYKEGLKLRRLKKNAVPSVFCSYPQYKVPKPVPERCPRKRAAVAAAAERPLKRSMGEKEQSESLEAAQGLLSVLDNSPACPIEAAEASEVEKTRHSSTQTSEDSFKQLQQAKRKIRFLQSKLAKKQAVIIKLQRQASEAIKSNSYFEKNIYHANVEKLLAVEEHGDTKAEFLLQQIKNVFCSRPRWHENVIRECILWSSCSPKGYAAIRERKILKLPCQMTLSRYLGPVSGEVGFTSLVKSRLEDECQKLQDFEKFTSLIIDEMAINPQCVYDKKMDTIFGKKDNASDPFNSPNLSYAQALANRLLCFVLCGLSTSFRIPCAYYFTKQLTGKELHSLTLSVIEEVERAGFVVVRVVTDNHKTNTAMFRMLGQGQLREAVPHPSDSSRYLFLAFDQNHIIKNIRSLFLEKEMMDETGLISGKYLKLLYQLQKNENIKPVRNLTHRHVEPTNLDKMNVSRAVLIFSPPVTAALECLQQHSTIHPTAYEFKDAGPTIHFLKNVYRWFAMHDVCNKTRSFQSRNPDQLHFFSCTDERLEWLEKEFLPYLENIKRVSLAANPRLQFLSKETHEAIKITTLSTVQCVRYLLKSGYHYVLTRKFNSDPVELMFSALRQMSGGNDMQDVRATLFSLEKILKTGRIITSKHCNANKCDMVLFNPRHQRGAAAHPASSVQADIPDWELSSLKKLHDDELGTPRTTMKLASLAVIAGYIIKVITDKVQCQSCVESVSQSRCKSPLLSLIANQDRGAGGSRSAASKIWF